MPLASDFFLISRTGAEQSWSRLKHELYVSATSWVIGCYTWRGLTCNNIGTHDITDTFSHDWNLSMCHHHYYVIISEGLQKLESISDQPLYFQGQESISHQSLFSQGQKSISDQSLFSQEQESISDRPLVFQLDSVCKHTTHSHSTNIIRIPQMPTYYTPLLPEAHHWTHCPESLSL